MVTFINGYSIEKLSELVDCYVYCVITCPTMS